MLDSLQILRLKIKVEIILVQSLLMTVLASTPSKQLAMYSSSMGQNSDWYQETELELIWSRYFFHKLDSYVRTFKFTFKDCNLFYKFVKNGLNYYV